MYSFPYPVLGNVDDVDGRIDMNVKVEGVGAQYVVSGSIDTSNEWYGNAITEGFAKWLLRVECSKTYYRRSIAIDDTKLKFGIPSDCVEGLVYLRPVLVACADESEFRPSGANKDYGGARFAVRMGGVLGIGPVGVFEAEKCTLGGKRHRSALIRIRPSDCEEGEAEIVLDHPTILVRIPGRDWKAFMVAKGFLPSAMTAVVGVPAVAEAIRKVDSEEFEEQPWSLALQRILKSHRIGREKSEFVAAQAVLNSPLRVLLGDLVRMAEADGGEE